jgi:hypothetical protein
MASHGFFAGDTTVACVEWKRRYVLWMNFEIGVERWWAGGFALRYFAGFAHGCSLDSCVGTVNGEGLTLPDASGTTTFTS